MSRTGLLARDFTAALLAHVADLPDPHGARAEALAAFRLTGLPGRRVEAWKYTDLAGKAAGLAPRPAPAAAGPEIEAPLGPFAGLGAYEIVFLDGRLVDLPEAPPAGLILGADQRAEALAAFAAFPIAGLVSALAADPPLLILQAEGAVARPVWLRFLASTPGFSGARVRIALEPGAALTLYESHESFAEAADAFAAGLVEISVGEGAALTRLLVQSAAADSVAIALALGFVGAKAQWRQWVWAEGGRLARIETAVKAEGPEVELQLDGAYGAAHGRLADLTSTLKLAAERARLTQTTRGVVRAGGKGVFQGRISVEKAAQKADARMRHDALLLEEGAEVDAKPELEIYADDVQCAHGNTMGALDREALFYLRSRGLPAEEARKLLTEAFLSAAFTACPDEAGAGRLRACIHDWLESGQGAGA